MYEVLMYSSMDHKGYEVLPLFVYMDLYFFTIIYKYA